MTQWQNDAACKGLTHLFFPRNGNTTRAQQLCNSCPVAGPCKQEALELATRVDLHGMWAGTTKRQREAQVGRNRMAWWQHD